MVKSKPNKENIKNEKATLGLILFIAVILIPIFILLSDWFRTSDLFSIKTIKIKGNTSISNKEILILSQIEAQANLFVFNADLCETRIREHPKILSAKITKHLPNKITIEITERKPIAIVNADSLYYIDANGVIWQKNQKEYFDLPFISGIPKNSLLIGEKLKIDNIDEIIELINITKRDDIISEIIADSTNDIIFYTLDKGYKVYLGKNNFGKKLVYLHKVLLALKEIKKDVKYIDLRFENEAIVKF